MSIEHNELRAMVREVLREVVPRQDGQPRAWRGTAFALPMMPTLRPLSRRVL